MQKKQKPMPYSHLPSTHTNHKMKHFFTAFMGAAVMLTLICIAGVFVSVGVVASECGDEDPYFYDN